jgi:chemotaxis protein MotB
MAEEVLEEEQEEEECPKCPPAGAPAWMATFADMATLLMAFFVLILSFAEFNVPKFKQISGSLREAFGVQKVVPVVEQPKGTTVISLNFSPNPTPAITDTLRQQTTELQQPELELRTIQTAAKKTKRKTLILMEKAVKVLTNWMQPSWQNNLKKQLILAKSQLRRWVKTLS